MRQPALLDAKAKREKTMNNLKRIENMNESILITGANIGLGKETARQLAMKRETKKVILFCRNLAKAEAAKRDLEVKTGKQIFEIITGDVADANSVRKAVEKIKEPIDAVILNAGGDGWENGRGAYAFRHE